MELPRIAIIDPNTLAIMGLRQMLLQVMPMMAVDCFGTMTEFQANHPERYAHYFVAMSIVLENRQFFVNNKKRTIVLTLSLDNSDQLADFHSLCINQPEQLLVRSLLLLKEKGHPHSTRMSQMGSDMSRILSDREIEVLSLIVKGLINKEIAQKLHISLSTVVTHRKNIMEKLGMRSVSALTIYAVMHGYVDINHI